MIKGLATLIGFQLFGELTAQVGHLPIPGPILGMAALLAWLHVKGEVDSQFGGVCDSLLSNMAILFVPVGVGIMSYSALFASAWPVIGIAIVAGAATTLLVTAVVTQTLSNPIQLERSRVNNALEAMTEKLPSNIPKKRKAKKKGRRN